LDIAFQKAENRLLSNPELSEKHGSGEKKARFKKWWGSCSDQQSGKFNNMALTPSNNNKKAAASHPNQVSHLLPATKTNWTLSKNANWPG